MRATKPNADGRRRRADAQRGAGGWGGLNQLNTKCISSPCWWFMGCLSIIPIPAFIISQDGVLHLTAQPRFLPPCAPSIGCIFRRFVRHSFWISPLLPPFGELVPLVPGHCALSLTINLSIFGYSRYFIVAGFPCVVLGYRPFMAPASATTP